MEDYERHWNADGTAQGQAPNWGSPLTMCNVSPQGNTAAIIASMLSQVFAANTLEGEYAWNVHRAELETAGMMGNLFGWDPVNTGAIYTYGGGGCWTYGLKYGLTRVLPDSRFKGVRTDAKVICSHQAHYVQQNATDWTGLGMDNIVHVRTDVATNQMDLVHLEEILKDLTARNIPIATVICTMAEAVGNRLFEWFRAGRKIDGKYTPYMSFTTGFRNADYNRDGTDAEAVVYALKSFPMNVFVTPQIMQWVLHCVHAARDEVLGPVR